MIELLPEVRGVGLSIAIAEAPSGGAVAELRWDGSSVALRPVAARQEIELRMEVEPRLHLLELRSLAGGEIRPGSIQLLVD